MIPAPADPETVRPDVHPEGLFPSVPELTYHADPTSLSQSGAKTLLDCPAQFAYDRQHPPEPSDAMDFGSAVDQLLFGGPETIVVEPDVGESWRTKAAKQVRDTARAAGRVALLRKDYDKACDMAEAVFRKPEAAQMLTDGRAQVSAWCVDDATGVMRRGRFDYLRDDLIVDYKTAFSADPREWQRNVARLRYHLQHAWYLDLARDLGAEVRGLVFVVQSKTPPYLTTVVELVPSAVDLGRALGRAALERYRDCEAAGVWPDYATGIVPLDLPDWAYRDHYNQEAS